LILLGSGSAKRARFFENWSNDAKLRIAAKTSAVSSLADPSPRSADRGGKAKNWRRTRQRRQTAR
jgi:hypothetical protein